MDQTTSESGMEEAARWHARLTAGDCTPAERRAFQAWLAQDESHALAWQRALQVARRVSRLAQVDPRLRDLMASDQANARRMAARWRAAAALVAAMGLATLAALHGRMGNPVPATEHYANTGMQQQVVDLADGSRVHLDVGARLDVQLTSSARRLELIEGRAYFEVAHDTTRPFAVDAAGVRTVALGTRFQVAMATGRVVVTLAEGSVSVTAQRPDAWSEVLRPGDQLQSDAAAGERISHDVDMPAAVGWSSNRLVYRSTPLAQVLDDINRYASVKLRLAEDALGTQPVGGTFIAGADSNKVAAALAAALPLNAVQVGAREIVLFRRYDAAD
jgi:transmembrane sensor